MLTFNKTNIRNLTILFGSATMVLASLALAPALPGMVVAFQDVPNAELLVRLALTLPGLFVAISAPFVGVLLDRLGRKPVLIVSITVYGLAGASGYVADSLVTILIGRALLGLAVAGLVTGFTTLITDYFTGARLNQFMGYQGAALGVGGVVFQIFGGLLADVGWRFPFLLYLVVLLLLPGVLFAIDEPQMEDKSNAQEGQKAREPFPIKTLAPIYAIVLIMILVLFISPIQLPFFLIEQMGVSNSQIGLALSAQTFSSIFSALLFQRVKARLSFQGILALAFLVVGINHAFTAVAATYETVVLGMLIGGLGWGLLPPTFNVWIASVTPASMRGRALGGFTASLFIGQFLTPIVTQPIVNSFGLTSIFAYAAVLSVLLALILAAVAAINRSTRESQSM